MLLFDFISYVEIGRYIQSEKFRCETVVFARILCRTTFDLFFGSLDGKNGSKTLTMPPNKSPEPTAVGAVSSTVAVHVPHRRWLPSSLLASYAAAGSFLR